MVSPRPGSKEHVRKKAWKPKVKTGCITCRIRRVKCDETKPFCHRCTSTGRKCDGYSSTLVPSNQTHEIARYARPSHSPLASAMAGLMLESVEEKEAFYFYQHHSAAELAGFFDDDFWQIQVLQACRDMPAIRHGMISLAAMHRKFADGRLPVVPDDASDKQLRFALQQSNRAIQEIVRSSPRKTMSDRINMMTMCVLFHCLACIQGHQAMALEHLRSGLKILREIDEDTELGKQDTGSNAVSLHTLRAMFVNMDVQARGIMNDDDMAKWEAQPRRDFAVHPRPFTNFLQARYYFEATFNDVLAFIQELDVRPPISDEGMQRILQEYRRIRKQVEAGTLLLERFLSDPATDAEGENREATIAVRLVHDQLEIMVKAFKGFGYQKDVRQIDWEMGELELHVLLDLCCQLLKVPPSVSLDAHERPQDYYPSTVDRGSVPEKVTPVRARPVFSSSGGILTALWLVSSRARDPILRRKAIAMMLEYPRREGVWDSMLAGRIAWETLLLEESGLAEEDIPGGIKPCQPQKSPFIREMHKIRDINIVYTGLRVATVEFRSLRQNEAGQPGVFRQIAW